MAVTKYIKEDWIKTENGGWSHIPQQIQMSEVIQWNVDMFLYSCYLYYVLDDPKLSDENFDCIVTFLEKYYDELPDRIKNECGKGKIKPNAHVFGSMLTDKEKQDAIDWKNNWNYNT